MTQTPIDIYVVGTGMVGYRQLTRETEEALKKSDRIYSVQHQRLVLNFLEEEYDGEVVDLTSAYTQTGNRREAYEQMAETVLDGAEEVDGPVTFALYGHPMVFVSPSRWVIERAPERGLEVETYPGISAMDCLYADIALDPAENGIQMFEATDLILREFELNPDVGAMIWQIGAVESVFYPSKKSTPERFTRLREYLEQFYPSDHTVRILETAVHPLGESKDIHFELGEFESMHDQINPSQTLYIPPVRQRPIQNEEVYEKMQSSEHVELITESEEYEGNLVETDE